MPVLAVSEAGFEVVAAGGAFGAGLPFGETVKLTALHDGRGVVDGRGRSYRWRAD